MILFIKPIKQTIQRGLLTPALLLALTVTLFASGAASPSRAQSASTNIAIGGSQIVLPVVQAASDAFIAKNPDVKIDTGVVKGTDTGFEKLCDGTLDIAMANRAITDSEIAKCDSQKIKFSELLLGYDALTVVVNQASKLTCISPDDVKKAFNPTSTTVKNWNVVDQSLGDVAISGVYTATSEAAAQFTGLVQSFVSDDGKLRADVQPFDAISKLSDKIGTDTNGVGLVTLADSQRVDTTRDKTLQIRNTTSCADPTVPNLDTARYPLATSLFLYVNTASLDRKPVADFLNYQLGTDGRGLVSTNGFVAASDSLYDRGLNYITTRQTGRTYSRIQSVNVPADTTGTVTVDGSPLVFQLLNQIQSNFAPLYTKIKVTATGFGNDAGYRKLCANTADVIGATRPPTDAEGQACNTAKVPTLTLKLGSQAVVVVISGKNSFASCLKADQLAKIFNSDAKSKKWSDVSSDYPATDLLVLTPADGAPETDLLLSSIVKQVAPTLREDATSNADAQYRAAGAQNAEGAITYMNYNEYQQALTAKVNIKAAALDLGKGCVAPSDATLKDGTYPLTQPYYVILNVNSFTKPEIKAFVWYLLSDDALATIAKAGLVGTDTASFSAARDAALESFAKNAAQATQSATLAATGNVPLPSAPTAGATTSATTAPTTAPTAAATIAATAAPTTAQ